MNMSPEVHAEFRPFGYRASSFSPFPLIFYCPLRILLICLPSSSEIEIITYESSTTQETVGPKCILITISVA